MSLIHGSHGLIYFVHQFAPKFVEAALLDDPEMLAAVTSLNKQIISLAPVLNSPTIMNGAQVQTNDSTVPVDVMIKQYHGATYLFAVAMRGASSKATFTLPGRFGAGAVKVLDENRMITAQNGIFSDTFAPWDVHLYKIDVAAP